MDGPVPESLFEVMKMVVMVIMVMVVEMRMKTMMMKMVAELLEVTHCCLDRPVSESLVDDEEQNDADKKSL